MSMKKKKEAMKYTRVDNDGDFDSKKDRSVEDSVLDDGSAQPPSPPPKPVKASKSTKQRSSSKINIFKPRRLPSPPRQEQQDSMKGGDGGFMVGMGELFLREQAKFEMMMREDNDDDDGGAFTRRQDDGSDISEEEWLRWGF